MNSKQKLICFDCLFTTDFFGRWSAPQLSLRRRKTPDFDLTGISENVELRSKRSLQCHRVCQEDSKSDMYSASVVEKLTIFVSRHVQTSCLHGMRVVIWMVGSHGPTNFELFGYLQWCSKNWRSFNVVRLWKENLVERGWNINNQVEQNQLTCRDSNFPYAFRHSKQCMDIWVLKVLLDINLKVLEIS